MDIINYLFVSIVSYSLGLVNLIFSILFGEFFLESVAKKSSVSLLVYFIIFYLAFIFLFKYAYSKDRIVSNVVKNRSQFDKKTKLQNFMRFDSILILGLLLMFLSLVVSSRIW